MKVIITTILESVLVTESPFCVSKVFAFCNYCGSHCGHASCCVTYVTVFQSPHSPLGNRVCEKAQGCRWNSQYRQEQFEIGWAEARPIFSFWPSFLLQKMFALTLIPCWKCYFYCDSVDQYTLGSMNYDRWPANRLKGLTGFSGNEVAVWDVLSIAKDTLELSFVHYK